MYVHMTIRIYTLTNTYMVIILSVWRGKKGRMTLICTPSPHWSWRKSTCFSASTTPTSAPSTTTTLANKRPLPPRQRSHKVCGCLRGCASMCGNVSRTERCIIHYLRLGQKNTKANIRLHKCAHKQTLINPSFFIF